MNIYLISGLGADEHAFDRLVFPENYIRHHLTWLEPEPNESLAEYAHRMAEGIDSRQKFVLIGLSFGGLVSIEISKFLKPEKLIIISSISQRRELPWYFRQVGQLGLHKSALIQYIKKSDRLLFWFFGTRSSKLQAYLKERIQATSVNYLKWSLHQIIHWKQSKKPEGLIHIHGSKDKLFPVQYCQPDIIISGGSHFMVVTHASVISDRIKEILRELTGSQHIPGI